MWMRPRLTFLMMPIGIGEPPSSGSSSSNSESKAGESDAEEHPEEDVEAVREEHVVPAVSGAVIEEEAARAVGAAAKMVVPE